MPNQVSINNIKDEYKKCLWHGERSKHATHECFKIIKLVGEDKEKYEKGPKRKFKPQRNAQLEEIQDDENENKNSFIYSIIERVNSNPFYIHGFLNNNKIKILLDTGADLTIIPKKFIEECQVEIGAYSGTVKSATGQELQILGQIEDVYINYDDQKIKLNGIIANTNWDYMITGYKVILQHPEIIQKILHLGEQITRDLKIQSLAKTPKEQLTAILQKNENLFAEDIHSRLERCTVGIHKIETGDATPIFSKPGKVPVHFEDQISEKIDKPYKYGLLVLFVSPWNTRLQPVTKQNGELRMCLDFRPVNRVCKKDSYQMQNKDQIFTKLSNAKIITTLDATSGYYQIALYSESQEKTEFTWNRKRYKFTGCLLGLSTPQRRSRKSWTKFSRTMKHH